jgi:F-type H+-transporting ATPase subunit alpha
MIIWAVGKGYLDPVPVEKVAEFEEKLIAFMHSTHKEIPDAIKTEKDLTEDTESRLHNVLKSFQTSFVEGKAPDPRSQVDDKEAAVA